MSSTTRIELAAYEDKSAEISVYTAPHHHAEYGGEVSACVATGRTDLALVLTEAQAAALAAAITHRLACREQNRKLEQEALALQRRAGGSTLKGAKTR
jgi:hypothetical protein